MAGKVKKTMQGSILIRLARQLFSPLAAPHPHLLRLNAQHLGDTDAQLVRLNDGCYEGGHIPDFHTVRHSAQRLTTQFAQLKLLDDSTERQTQFIVPLFGYLGHGSVKAQPCFHTNGQQIERIGQRPENVLLPL